MTEFNGMFLPAKGEGYFDDLVKLQPLSHDNRIGKRFRVNLRLEVDAYHLNLGPKPGWIGRKAQQLGLSEDPGPDIRLVVRLKHCNVRYVTDGLDIPMDSKYRSAIEIGHYTESRSADEMTGRQANFEVGTKGKANLGSSDADIAWGASGEGGFGRQNSHLAKRNIVVTQDLYEIETIPDGWRVGDTKLGDPLKRGGWLYGQYFGRAVEEYPSTCAVEFTGNATKGKIAFHVTVRDGLRVERCDGERASQSEHEQAVSAMRDRLAGICVERAMLPAATAGADGEVLLYSVHCECELGEDGDTEVREQGGLATSVTPQPQLEPAIEPDRKRFFRRRR